MSENSAISWTDHTFNPWWGCVKISPACTNCYAATFDHRLGGDHWGPKSERKFFGEKHWNGPRKWNRNAEKAGIRQRVFCASMADVFEDREDLIEPRRDLFNLIAITQSLDWLLLTKRPENLARMLPWVNGQGIDGVGPWGNVWIGTTVESQEYADARIAHLLSVPAVVHFLSCEPLLGPIDLSAWFGRDCPETGAPLAEPRWVIAGCESGHGARETGVEWLRSLRDQCVALDAAFFLKQGMFTSAHGGPILLSGNGSKTKHGGVIELPYLDGIQHAAFPQVTP